MNLLAKWKVLLIICAGWTITTIAIKTISNRNAKVDDRSLKKLIWWRNGEVSSNRFITCSYYRCLVGTRDDMKWQEADAVLFYASTMNITDMPIPRPQRQLWALLHEESPRNALYLLNEKIMNHFNFTSTFSRFSDRPITTSSLQQASHIFTQKYMKPVGEKNMLKAKENLAPVMFMHTDCSSMSGREAYVQELMKYIEIDSYGECLKNRQLPHSLKDDYLNTLYSPETLSFLSRYKFIIAYENGVCNDYITEKFWRPLIVGSIPIYFGSPTIRDWAPNNKSVIYIDDFASPKDLADFIRKIDADDIEYNSYLNHKYNKFQPTTNIRLENELHGKSDNFENFFEDFACFVCENMHTIHPSNTYMASRHHYSCPLPVRYPPMKSRPDESWEMQTELTECFRDELDRNWRGMTNFSKEEMTKRCAYFGYQGWK